MRLLDRYLLRELLKPLGYCLGGFLIFWIVFDLFSEFTAFQKANLGFLDVAEYYALKMPGMLVFPVMPVSLLLALLYAISNHGRHNEFVAMRAAGINYWRLSLSYLCVGLLASLFLFVLTEFIFPNGDDDAREILDRYTQDSPSKAEKQWQKNLCFNNDRENRQWQINAYNVDTHEMLGPTVGWAQADGQTNLLFATRGVLTNGVWTFYDGQYNYRTPEMDVHAQSNFTVMAFPEFDETPRLIKSEIKISGTDLVHQAKKPRFTLGEMIDYRRLHPVMKPTTRARFNTQLNGRLAQPWTCFVVVLIALPFGSLTGRRNVFVGVAASLFICFAFFFRMGVVFGLGTSGFVPGWIAAWSPHLLFGGAGIWMTQKMQ
jgi:lipopolysaccharide export system permease protein